MSGVDGLPGIAESKYPNSGYPTWNSNISIPLMSGTRRPPHRYREEKLLGSKKKKVDRNGELTKIRLPKQDGAERQTCLGP